MITVTPAAAEQISFSAKQSNSESMSLRIAARITPDETIDYILGFDTPKDEDMKFSSEGIDILVDPEHAELLNGMTIDYVQLEDGEHNFIFQNPNDPSYKPPREN